MIINIIAIVISAISLLVAVVSLRSSLKSQHLQDKVNEIDVKLKNYELEQIEKERQRNACVEVRIVSYGKTEKMKVWNSGNETAYNVTASVNEESQIMILDNEKMPFEVLEPQKNFELILITHMGSASKLTVTTEWENKDGVKFSKQQLCDR